MNTISLNSIWPWLLLVLDFGYLHYLIIGDEPGYRHPYLRLWDFLIDLLIKARKSTDDDTQNIPQAQGDTNIQKAVRPESFMNDPSIPFDEVMRQRDIAVKNIQMNREEEIAKARSIISNLEKANAGWRTWLKWITPFVLVINCCITYCYLQDQLSKQSVLPNIETEKLKEDIRSLKTPKKPGLKAD